MAQPIWQTPVGSLGSIPEEVFYSIIVQAVDPENPSNPVRYRLISGELPGGIQLTINGTLEGVPNSRALVKGVPFPVNRDITSKFAVRAYTERVVNGQVVVDRFADRTFSVTVAGQDVPEFVTPTGLVATFNDAGPASIQIEFTDTDIDDAIQCRIATGSLPPGLTISNAGLISGIIDQLSASTLYTFAVEITDGKAFNLRTFTIQVNRVAITTPFLLNAAPSDIGTYRNDNYFAYQFRGFDFGNQTLEYVLVSGLGLEIPPGTQLDSETGWLYGTIPDLGITEFTYNFKIQVRELLNPGVASPEYTFSVKIVGFIDTNIVWLTPENLGSIDNGEISTLRVEAVNFANRVLQYRLEPGRYPVPDSGVYNKLPQGLTLLSSGDIAGRVSFNTFAVDLGSTTFDENIRTRFVTQATTFDLTNRFTVNAYSSDGLINVLKEFEITVVRQYNEPFENLYIKAMPPQNDRDLINSLLQNSDIFPVNLIYRSQDLYFGIAKNVIYQHAFGLRSATVAEYISALDENHYWKNLTLGSIETAVARNSSGDIIYEVVYSRVFGGLLNDLGQSVSKEVTWPYPVTVEGQILPVTTVYPNSLTNMRDQVIDVVGQVDTVLPRWMVSRQDNGRVLGFTPAWVIAYVKPGFGKQVAYNVRTKFGQLLNQVDFGVDRYSLDRTLSKHWDPVTQSWTPPGAETSFDLDYHYRTIDDSTIPGGANYQVGNQILVLGTQVGGVTPENDIRLTVSEVDEFGSVTDVFCQGIAPTTSDGETFISVAGVDILTGTGSRFTVKRVNLNYFVTVSNGGTGYRVGDRLIILGSSLGGVDVVNDCQITVIQVGTAGNILELAQQGTAVAGVETYQNRVGNKIFGAGAVFDFVVASGEITVFDGGSLKFIAPVDNYTTSDEFDKYLVFPKRTILT